MKQLNIKTPTVFRVALVLVTLLMVSCYMVSGMYAKYSTDTGGNVVATVADISYKIIASDSTKTLADVSALGNQGAVIAVEESFTIVNDGDVAYDYTIFLSLAGKGSNLMNGYTLGAPTKNVFILSSCAKADLPNYTENAFYYRKGGDTWVAKADGASVAGTLAVGEEHTYTIYYFINVMPDQVTGLPTNVSLGIPITLNYAVNCTQIN